MFTPPYLRRQKHTKQIENRSGKNLLFNANAEAPDAVHRQSHMKNPRDMKSGDRRAARIYTNDIVHCVRKGKRIGEECYYGTTHNRIEPKRKKYSRHRL